MSSLQDLIFEPAFLLGVAVLVTLIISYGSHPNFKWILLFSLLFVATLQEYRDEWVDKAPLLITPFEQMRAYGRQLTILMLAILLAWIFLSARNLNPAPGFIFWLTVTHLIILIKSITIGNEVFAFLAFMIFLTVQYAMLQGPLKWLNNEKDIESAFNTLVLVGVAFVVVNGIQAFVDPYPISFPKGGRFLGTTGNPQHAATLLALVLPSCLYFFNTGTRKLVMGIFILVLVYFLMWTQSRTGLIMLALVIVIFNYEYFKRNLLVTTIVCSIVIFIFFQLIRFDIFPGSSKLLLLDRITGEGNTRELVWKGMLAAFSYNPIFGIPFQGDRFTAGENSWLSVAAGFGIVGLLPLIIYGLGCVGLVIKLFRIINISDNPRVRNAAKAVAAGISSLLIGSFAEGFLLGTLSFPLFCMLLYIIIGSYIVKNQHLPAS